MASTTTFNLVFSVIGLCSVFLNVFSAEAGNQLSSDGITDGQGSSFFLYQQPELPRDCKEVRQSCSSPVSSGIYLIKPDGYKEPFEVYCENDTESSAWMTILRRCDGSVDFNRRWNDYKEGFGFLSTEFWLGNVKLSFLTNQAVYELRIDITFENGTSCDIKYNTFRISDEWSGYKLSPLGSYRSDAVCRWNEGSGFTDCNDVSAAGITEDGIYLIHPAEWGGGPFEVYCNMSIDGGNWTVIQRREDGSENFYRNWTEYKNGFGDLRRDFWLGNEKLHHITKQGTYEYRIDYVHSSTSYYNKYTNFYVDNEDNKYRLANVGTRTGSRGYNLHNINNTPFSTHDEDNDGQSYDCAEGHRSGWWHGAYFETHSSTYCVCFPSGGRHVICSYANPNGDYNGGNGQNIFDNYYHDCNQKYTELKIRRIS